MTLLDLLTGPWALQPEKLREMQEVYATHLRGEKIDVEAIEARMGRPLASEQQDYQVRQGGVAVLGIDGVIAPKANLFTKISGGTSAQMLQQQLDSAMADSRVTGIVLAIDSPGGSVSGSPSLASAVREYSAEKPIVSVAAGTMASAAYWIGSAANAVYIAERTAQVGSIGVVATHDYTPNSRGSKTTEITAGKYKRIASGNAPLSVEGADYLQAQVDHIYSVFVDAVAEHRGVAAETVQASMADGRVFIGQQAIDAGLVDGVATVDQLVDQMARNPSQFAKRRTAQIKPPAAKKSTSAGAAAVDETSVALAAETLPTSITTTGDEPMAEATTPVAPITADILQREHAPLYAQVLAAGAAQERDRIKAVREQSLPGHEALIEQLAADGKTTGPEAAMAVNAAERASRAAAAAAHRADAPPAVQSSAANDTATVKTSAEKAAEAKAYAAKHGVDFVAAYKALGFDA